MVAPNSSTLRRWMEETTLETLEVSALNLLEVTLGEVMERGIPAFDMLSISTTPPDTRLVLDSTPLKIGDMTDGAMLSLSLSVSFEGSGGGVRVVVVFRRVEGTLVDTAKGLGFAFRGTIGRGARTRSAVASSGDPREQLTLQQIKRRRPAAYCGFRAMLLRIEGRLYQSRRKINNVIRTCMGDCE